MIPWAHPSHPHKRHLDPFSYLSRAHERDQQTHKQTYRQITLLHLSQIVHIYAMHVMQSKNQPLDHIPSCCTSSLAREGMQAPLTLVLGHKYLIYSVQWT